MRLPIFLVAGFAVLFAALTGTTRAADWLPGGTSTDWNTGTNWNGGVVPNNAGAFITSNTGNIATISANAAGPVTELQVATWYNNGRLDHTAGALTVTNTGWPYGWLLLGGGSYGNGTYNIANTAGTGGALTGFGTGSGSLSVNGEIRVGAGSWWDHATGVLNINTSGTVQANGSLVAGNNVGDVGTVNIDAGTVMISGDYTNSGQFGHGDSAATGNLKISGGSISFNNRLALGVGNGSGAGGNVGTLTLSGGTLTTDAAHDEDWHAGVNLASGYDTATGGTATVNLNGGTLSTLRVFSETGGTGIKGTSTFNFNGGTLKAQAARGNFMEGLTLANVRDIGAVVDTNGFDVTISQALLHSSIGGDNATDGGLTKNGAGVLILSNVDNSFNGNIVVNGGTLRANTSRNSYLATSNLGANDSNRSITVNSGAALDFTNSNIFSGVGATAGGLPQVVLNGGTMQSSRFNVIGHVTLNGGTLNQTTTDAGGYEGYEFLGNITVGGSTASTISSSNGKANHIAGGNNVLITVADATSSSAADLIISNPLRNGSGDYAGSGAITKAGAGTLQLTAANTYSGSSTVNAGTLLINGTHDQGTGANAGRYLVAAGATLGGTGTIKLSDTNGGGTGLAITGTLSPGDPSTASGIGTLTLDGTSSARSVVSFETGAALAMQLNTGASDLLVITGAAAGDVAFNNNTINFTDLSSSTLPPGQYVLISSTSAGTFTGLTVNGAGVVTAGLSIGTGLAAYPSTSLQVVGNNLVLNISGMPDNVPPTISGTFSPLTLVSGAGGTVSLPNYTGQAVTSDNVAVTSVVQSPAIGSARSVGTTHVTLTASDAAGNTASTSFDVVVNDGTAPVIGGTFTPLFISTGGAGSVAIPDYTAQASATDNVAVVGNITQTPVAGTLRPAGPVTVILSAADAAGNVGTLTLNVTVSDGTESHGIASKPTVGAYFDGAFPPTPPVVGSFTAVDAYPNLSFVNPTGILQVPGQSKMMVWQREGGVYIFDKADTTATKTLVLDISNQCQGWDDAGLMNLVFHPQFDLGGAPGTNRHIFVYYEWVPPGTVVGSPTTRPNNTIPNMRDRISRFELDANGVALPDSEVIIMDQAATNTWHNGSGMFFHPVDGYLYWSNGDDTNSANAQSITGPLLGGVFRVDVDKRGGNFSHAPVRVPTGVTTQNYFIPNNNPFVGQSGVNEETFAIGLRSPHRMTHDAVTGRTFIADVGAGDREEVDIIEPTETSGMNFQWPQKEGYNGDMTPPYLGVNKRPVLDYNHSEGSAIIGGYVYRGAAFPELQGKYLFADNVVNKVWAMNEGTTPATKTLLTTVPTGPGPDSGRSYIGISSWGVDSDGEVYICRLSSTGGTILKLQRGSAPSTPLPATLSATGLFSDVAGFVPSDKLIPYTINAPFWSDKAIKSRWLTVPTGTTIGFTPTGDWTFPAGSVAMKHFDLATDETNSAVRKRLETRVLLKMASGGSYGATYKWRADNSDADLINEGVTEIVPIAIPSVGTFTPADIGSPGIAGSTTVNGNTLTVSGGGSDIWGTSDQFHFAHQQRTGDFDISMKATSFNPAVLYSKFGLMARESLAANSPHYFIFAWASNAGRGANTSGYEDHYRTTAGGNTTANYPAAGQHLVSYPNGWLRMVRKGNTFISYTSADGANWAEYARQTIAMPATLYFGIAMNAHDNGLAATGTIELQTTRLQPWYYPGRTDCTTCHNNNAGGGFIGPNTRQFNKDHDYTATGVTDNQLRAFSHVGMFNTTLDEPTIPTYQKLAHVNQTSESLEKRARSYVDTNCANCHRPGGVPALWDARFDTPLANQGIIYGSVGTTLGLVNPRVIVPQSTSRSMMHHRIDRVGANQMPPIGRNLVDEVGVQLITDWINSLPANDPPVVVLTSPINGANVITPNPVALEATASDADGIVRVEFFDGTTKIGEDTTAPYAFSHSGITEGTHTLFARAYDSVNNSADSASVTITVTELPGLVRAKINFQTEAAVVPSGYVADSGLPFAARGNGMTYGWSRDNTVDSRERNLNADKRYDTLVHMQKDHGGGDVTSTWSIALPNSSYSVHVVTGDASATDGVQSVTANGVALTTGTPAGQNFYEATATVTVTNGLLTISPAAGANNAKLCYVDISEMAPSNGNQLPVVALTGVSPDFPTIGGSAKLSATASDPDGTITKVEYYANGVKIGEDDTAPYVFSWTGYTAGTYHITARAVDDDGAAATSSSAIIVPVFSPGQTGLYAQYYNAADFTSFVLARVEPTLNANYGNAAPVAGMVVDNFSTRWRGRLLTRDPGTYTLKFFADDGVRVWLDGNLVIDRWGYDPGAVTANLTLTGNSLHELRVDHREDGGGALIQMLWSGPGFAEEIVPTTNLITPATGVASDQLAGTIIGTNGSWNNDPNSTKAAVFDGNLNTFYDALEADGAWAGLDLGEGNSRIITEVRYCPRAGSGGRMVGGLLQGANTADFSDAVTLHTVAEAPPPDGVLTSHSITSSTAFRYLRYLSPAGGFCNVAEVVFFGADASSPVPLNLMATAGNAQVGLSWLPSANATGYNVKRSLVSDGPYATIANNVAVNTFTDTALTNGTTYFYVVSALNGGGETADSAEVSATPFTPAPAGLVATAGNAQVALTWSSVSGATGYDLKRSSSPTGPFTTLAANLPGTAYTDTSAANFTLYYYVLSTLHPAGNSADSTAVSAVPLPPKLTGTVIGTTGSWNDDPNITRAAVFDDNINTFFDALEANGAWAGLDLGAGASKQIAAIRFAPRNGYAGRMNGGTFQGANSADFSDAVTLHTLAAPPTVGVLTLQLVSNATAFRYVRYLSPDGGFCNVAEVEFYGSDVLPAAPTGLIATAGNMEVELAWSTVSGATSYNVKRATTTGGPYTLVGSITGTTGTDTTAANNTTYYYVITAVNAGGESAISNEASATPVSPPITETEMQAPAMTMTATDVSLSVTASVIGHTYQLQKSETLAPGSWQNIGSPVPGTGGTLNFSEPVSPPSTPRCFYRISIQR